jgi:hypothetical protein
VRYCTYEEFVDLIAASGGKWVFIGMESIAPANLADVNKGFNKPAGYAAVLQRLAQRNVYAITSFIFGMDNDRCRRSHASGNSHLAPGPADFCISHSSTRNASLQTTRSRRRLTRPNHW